MAIMTALLLIVGVAALFQRGENGSWLLGGAGTYEPQPDTFTLRAGRVQTLDVLLNDIATDSIDPEELSVVQAPRCGTALATGGAIQFSESESCIGQIVLSYCVPSEGNCQAVPVTLTLIQVDPDGASGPLVVDNVQQGVAPQDTQQVAMRQPKRLTLPSSAEVITPSEATESVRRLGEVAPSAIAANETETEAGVTVSQTSARSGSVATSSSEMAAPEIAEESAGIALAASQGSSAPRRTVRMSLGTASQGDAVPPVLPTRPDGQLPNPVRLGEAPVMNGGSTPQAVPNMPRLGEVSTETAEAIGGDVPVSPQAPADVADAAPVAEQGTEIAAADPPDAGSAPRPDEATTEVVATPEAAPSASGIEVASEPAAQTAQPDLPTAPVAPASENSGMLASIARSNTVFGATLTAAKALFSPEEEKPTVLSTPAGESAPRPTGFAAIEELDLDASIVADTAGDLSIPTGVEPVRPRSQSAPVTVAALSAPDDAFSRPRNPAPVATDALQPDDEILSGAQPEAAPEDVAEDEPVEQPAQEEETVIAALQPEEPGAAVVLDLPATRPSGANAADLCAVDFSVETKHGAELIGSLSSPCRPEQQFLVEHAGLTFSAETDADGFANFIVPALQTNAIVRVTFPDGGSAVGRDSVPGMSRMTRIAVVWTDDPLNFDLYAREFSAAPGSDGEVWAGNARERNTARRMGGGYITQLGPVEGPGARAEVYTLVENARTSAGVIEFRLALRDPAAACDSSPVIRVVRSERAEIVRNRDLRLDLGACGEALKTDVGIGLRDIRIARSQ
ncbi:MAG: hypothetical protein AAGE76_05755 [Pseudomonadota bacterium]